MEKIQKDINKIKKEFGLTTSVVFNKRDYYFDGDNQSRNIYTLTLKRNGISSSFKFGDSIDNTQKGIRPKDYEIIYAIIQDYYSYLDSPNVNEFMSMFGYEDKKQANKIYNAVKRNYLKVNKLFTENEVEQLGKIFQENGY